MILWEIQLMKLAQSSELSVQPTVGQLPGTVDGLVAQCSADIAALVLAHCAAITSVVLRAGIRCWPRPLLPSSTSN